MDNRNIQGMRNSNMTGSSFKIGNKVKTHLIQNPGQAGNLYLSGFDYEAYNTSTDGNEYIYQWTATELGVTLI